LIREETAGIPQHLVLFDNIYILKGGRNTKKQLLWLSWLLPRLLLKRYQVVLDLQNNAISKIARNILMPSSWAEFDKSSPVHACERYRRTIDAAGFIQSGFCRAYSIRNREDGINKLFTAGWNGTSRLVVLNPAGAFITRNWELEKYVAFARLFQREIDPHTKFLVLGLPAISHKAAYFQEELGEALINLTGQTTQAEVFNIIQHIALMVSEDSALLHMAYLSDKPSIGLLGSTRNDWTDPLLPHTAFFHSADLPCGNCMLPACKWETVRCMERITPEMVLQKAKLLLDSSQ
jgi:ADP-heptose:LPS heptosyltransferase